MLKPMLQLKLKNMNAKITIQLFMQNQRVIIYMIIPEFKIYFLQSRAKMEH